MAKEKNAELSPNRLARATPDSLSSVVPAISMETFFSAIVQLLGLSRNKQKQLIQRKEERGEQRSNWQYAQHDVLQLILEKLSMADYIRVASVCPHWRTCVTNAIASNSYLSGLPVLMLFSHTIRHDLDPGFLSLKGRTVYYPKRPLYGWDECCVGSVDGWLIMADVNLLSLNAQAESAFTDSDSSPFFFWNPVSDARVMLPSQLPIPSSLRGSKYLFLVVKASSGPNCPDCIVAGQFIDYGHLAYCRLADKSWTVIEAKKDMKIKFSDMQILDGKLYVLTVRGEKWHVELDSILVYDLQGHSPPTAKLLIRLQHQLYYSPHENFWWEQKGSFHMNNSVSFFLARDPTSGDLLLVFKVADVVYHSQSLRGDHMKKKFVSQPKEKEFIIYKLDMSRDDARLVKVNNLGDRILFATFRDSMVIPISSLSGPKDLVRGNCIYFAHAYPCLGRLYRGFQVVLMFCLTEKKIKYIPLCNSAIGIWPSCVWFTPTF